MNNPVKPVSSKPFKSIAHTTYEGVYSSDLQRSAKWYYKAFGFYITIMNPDFGIVEMMPGRILCMSTQIEKPFKVGFVTKNMNALKRQLVKENIPFELEEENQLKVQDPDGNTIVIRSRGYGVEHLKAFAPEQTFRWRTRVRLETRDEMHLIAKRIEDDLEFECASEEVVSLCGSEGISTIGEAFIVSECRHLALAEPGKPRPTKIGNIYACLSIPCASGMKLPEGMEYLITPFFQ